MTSQRLQGTGAAEAGVQGDPLLCDKSAARAWGIVQWAWGLRLDHAMQGARERVSELTVACETPRGVHSAKGHLPRASISQTWG